MGECVGNIVEWSNTYGGPYSNTYSPFDSTGRGLCGCYKFKCAKPGERLNLRDDPGEHVVHYFNIHVECAFGSCSKTCGGGKETCNPKCVRTGNDLISEGKYADFTINDWKFGEGRQWLGCNYGQNTKQERECATQECQKKIKRNDAALF